MLVVGVGGHEEDASRGPDLAQGQGEPARAPVEVQGLERRLGRRGRDGEEEGEDGGSDPGARSHT